MHGKDIVGGREGKRWRERESEERSEVGGGGKQKWMEGKENSSPINPILTYVSIVLLQFTNYAFL